MLPLNKSQNNVFTISTKKYLPLFLGSIKVWLSFNWCILNICQHKNRVKFHANSNLLKTWRRKTSTAIIFLYQCTVTNCIGNVMFFQYQICLKTWLNYWMTNLFQDNASRTLKYPYWYENISLLVKGKWWSLNPMRTTCWLVKNNILPFITPISDDVRKSVIKKVEMLYCQSCFLIGLTNEDFMILTNLKLC